MRVRSLSLLALFVAACSGPEDETRLAQADSPAVDPSAADSSAPAEALPDILTVDDFIEQLPDPGTAFNRFTSRSRLPDDGERLFDLRLNAQGEIQRLDWVDCDGYIVNRPSSGFCQDPVPENWVPYTFNGGTFYYAPLGG